MIAAQTIIGVLEDAVNRLLRLDAESLKEFGELSGRVLKLELSDVGMSFYLFPSESGLHTRTQYAGVPDVVLRGQLSGFLSLALGSQARAFSSGKIEITGDLDVGQRFQQILRHLDFDWREQAAQWMGDPLAHQLASAVRAARDWTLASATLLARDMSEYLHHEVHLLPPRREVELFLDAVDIARADVDRLEQRIARIEHGRRSQGAG